MRELVDGISVVGAGVAGLTLAAALRRQGLPVEVTGVRVGGSILDGGGNPGGYDRGLHLWPGALAALDHIGATRALLARGTRIERLRLWSSTGRVLADLGDPEGAGVVGGLAIRASALVDVLMAACAGVQIDVGRRAIGYVEDPHGVVITFDGGWPLRAPVAVGADGVRSAIRAHCLDDGPAGGASGGTGSRHPDRRRRPRSADLIAPGRQPGDRGCRDAGASAARGAEPGGGAAPIRAPACRSDRVDGSNAVAPARVRGAPQRGREPGAGQLGRASGHANPRPAPARARGRDGASGGRGARPRRGRRHGGRTSRDITRVAAHARDRLQAERVLETIDHIEHLLEHSLPPWPRMVLFLARAFLPVVELGGSAQHPAGTISTAEVSSASVRRA